MLDLAEQPDIVPKIRRRGRPVQSVDQSLSEDVMLALAFHSFAERGFEGTTVRELAKQLGVSHNLINVRFGRKDELWKRAVDWRLRRASSLVTSAFDSGNDPEMRLRDLVRRFCLWATENPDIVALAHLEGNRGTWRLDHIVESFILPFKQRLDTLIAAVAAVRPVGNISTAALLALLVQGVGYYFSATPLQERIGAGDEVAPVNFNRQAGLMAEFLLSGLLP